ncbi:MAG: AraC family transcriptional regulator [Sneathiellaceae bacterium]
MPEAAGTKAGDLLFDVTSVGAPARRAHAWADALCEHYYPLDLRTRGEAFEVGRMYIRDIASLRFGALECDPMEVHLRAEHVSRQADEFYMIPFTTRSALELTQFGRAGQVRPGDIGFVCTGSPYIYRQPERDRFTALRMPTAPVRDRVPYADDLTARVFPGDQAMVAIFLDYARSCLAHGDGLQGEQPGVLKCLADLFALAISAPGAAAGSEESAVRAAHRQRALRHIDSHLHRRDLRPGTVAQALRLSPRYLQKIFAEHDERLAGVIRSRRIAEARRLLAGAIPGRPSISQIAYAVGFDDVAHFSRAFRDETGTTPSAFRDSAAVED